MYMMLVVVIESVPEHVRGYLSRFLQELSLGTYVGTVSPRVADNLWTTLLKESASGRVIFIRPTNSEVGYKLQIQGDVSIQVKDVDGLQLPVRNSNRGVNASP